MSIRRSIRWLLAGSLLVAATLPQPTVSAVPNPDARRILFVRGGDIYSISPTGAHARRLTTTGNNGQPAWSPSGSRIVFVSTRDGDADIFTMRGDGGAVRKLTFNRVSDVDPAWGPSGRRIAFSRSYRFVRAISCDTPCETGWAPWVMGAWGGSQRRIDVVGGVFGGAFFEDMFDLTWAPDGRHLAGIGIEYEPTQDYGAYVFTLDGTVTSLLYSSYTKPAWATDGDITGCALDGVWKWGPAEDPVTNGEHLVTSDTSCSFASMSGGRRFVVYVRDGVLRGRLLPAGPDIALAIPTAATDPPHTWTLADPYDWAPSGRLLAASTPAGLQVLAPDGSVSRLLPVHGTDPNW